MKAFASLLDRLTYTPSRNGKLLLMRNYFLSTPDPDRGYALAALTDGLPLNFPLRRVLAELGASRFDPELFRLSREDVGDTAETVALIWPECQAPGDAPRLTDIYIALADAGRNGHAALLTQWLDRLDATATTRRRLLRDEIRAAIHPNGVLLIPSFAVERAQELISDIGRLIAEGELPDIPIHVDSPLATKASKVFARHHRELEDGAVLMQGLRARNLHFTETREQSMALDRLHGFHIVIAASGMCDAGRIRHRLKNWIWRDEATVPAPPRRT